VTWFTPTSFLSGCVAARRPTVHRAHALSGRAILRRRDRLDEAPPSRADRLRHGPSLPSSGPRASGSNAEFARAPPRKVPSPLTKPPALGREIEKSPHLDDLVGRAVQGAADNQEHPLASRRRASDSAGRHRPLNCFESAVHYRTRTQCPLHLAWWSYPYWYS
jgi:hypothetical protein